jgi:Uma2 family endonuclease
MSEALTYQTRRWTRAEYDRLIDHGVFQPGERLELIGGELVVREPQGDPHAHAIELVGEALHAALGPGWRIRVQLPVALDEESEPEPDVSVVPGSARGAPVAKPGNPCLVVEVAQWSLAFDRERKAGLYARAGVPDYWILDLTHRALEVHRDPVGDAAAAFGWRYREVQHLGPGDTVTPLAAPRARIAVADLLP